MEFRKLVLQVEEIHAEAGARRDTPVRRAAGIVVIRNPCAGRFVEDLTPLFDVGMELGQLIMKRTVDLLGGKPVSYGKAAVVGVGGDVEHAAAILHPKLGKAIREAVGGGEAIIPSNAKVAGAGTPIDVPLANKDNIWSFDELDTVTLAVPDAPRPDEIVVAMVVADGGRLHARVGKGRAVV